MMSDPRYPIGEFAWAGTLTVQERREKIEVIAALPAKLRAAVAGLSDAQLDTPYREGGWTVRQVVHHLADSHMNAYVRMRLALTEDVPQVKPYDEAKWAELADARTAPIAISLTLLDGLHSRWAMLLKSLEEKDFGRTFTHPEHKNALSVDWLVAIYAWHCLHHVAHITALRERMGWLYVEQGR
ncbi:putative metal-dependent hydrolase [candidate division KSB1 bacterium]|nr:MAG: putative metal-dependent hydrolase [candidate division KSB1 bacterium]